jgi:FkbM family methyltransferase
MQKETQEEIKKTHDQFLRVFDLAKTGVYLYGAGFVGRWAIEYLDKLNIPVLGILDSDEKRWGSSFEGTNILSPLDADLSNKAPILISARHAVPAVKRRLIDLSCPVMSVDSFVVHQTGTEVIEKVEALFSHSQKSLDTYDAILMAMLTGFTDPLARNFNSNAFFDEFGFFNRSSEIFVDAGAYVGDSLERFIWSVNGVFSAIHAFEPGKPQFEALQRRVKRLEKEWATDPDTIFLVNKGLSHESFKTELDHEAPLIQTRLKNKNEISHKSGQIVDSVEVVSLDEYFAGDRFTFLKVDVEGSEAELINGATETIRYYRPRIALSVYHYPTDIFTLPLLCAEKNADYIFTLQHHSSQLMDTVLYCKDQAE